MATNRRGCVRNADYNLFVFVFCIWVDTFAVLADGIVWITAGAVVITPQFTAAIPTASSTATVGILRALCWQAFIFVLTLITEVPCRTVFVFQTISIFDSFVRIAASIVIDVRTTT